MSTQEEIEAFEVANVAEVAAAVGMTIHAVKWKGKTYGELQRLGLLDQFAK